jgi:hypothetical protein
MARDLYYECGDNQPENENINDGKAPRYRIVNEKTSSIITTIIIQNLTIQIIQIDSVWDSIHQPIRTKKSNSKSSTLKSNNSNISSSLDENITVAKGIVFYIRYL